MTGGGGFKQLFHHAGKQSEHIQNQAPTNPVVGPSGPLFASYSKRSTTLVQKNSGRGRFPPKAGLVLLCLGYFFLSGKSLPPISAATDMRHPVLAAGILSVGAEDFCRVTRAEPRGQTYHRHLAAQTSPPAVSAREPEGWRGEETERWRARTNRREARTH